MHILDNYPKKPVDKKSLANRKLVCGVGINDADYLISYLGKETCPIYMHWKAMITRCYSERDIVKNNNRYKGCFVDPLWHKFSNFRSWVLTQDVKEKDQLDKDLLYPGNKIYSPDKCIFVSPLINSLFLCDPARKGIYPQGVDKRGNRFRAQIRKYNKKVHIGYFSSIEEAEKAYLIAKKEYVHEIIDTQNLSEKLVTALLRRVP